MIKQYEIRQNENRRNKIKWNPTQPILRTLRQNIFMMINDANDCLVISQNKNKKIKQKSMLAGQSCSHVRHWGVNVACGDNITYDIWGDLKQSFAEILRWGITIIVVQQRFAFYVIRIYKCVITDNTLVVSLSISYRNWNLDIDPSLLE